MVEVPYSTLSYSWRLAEIGDMSGSVPIAGGRADECCDILADARAWELEVLIYRDSQDQHPWIGVLRDPVYRSKTVELSARDLFSWFERRVLPYNRKFVADDLAAIFQQYAKDALVRDNGMGITLNKNSTGLYASREVKATDHVRAADEMREVARSGVDWTMRGRELSFHGELTAPSFDLITQDFVEPSIPTPGSEMATEVIVQGTDPDGNVPIFGVAGGVHHRRGLIQVVIDDESIKDTHSAKQAAKAYWEQLSSPPRIVEGVLRQDANVEMDDLVCGRVGSVDVEAGCRRVDEDMRLVQVSVSVQVGNDGKTESVTPSFVPLGG